jgi:FkbM family methyltransferase
MIPGYLVDNGHIGLKRAKHGLFMFNRNDLFIGKSLDTYGEWCEPEILLLRNYVREGDVVLDVGANIGTHTIAFAGMVGSAGRVHAFEPQPALFYLLCGNVALNCLANVSAHQTVVGSGEGEVDLPAMPPPDKPYNFGSLSLAGPGSGERVGLVSIDSLHLPRCRLIKIDVEGMEGDVLNGAQKTVARLQPLLFVENDTLGRSAHVIESIFGLGYKAYWHITPYFHQANFFGNRENIFAQYQPSANLLCMPRAAPFDAAGLMECTGTADNWKSAAERINASLGGGAARG